MWLVLCDAYDASAAWAQASLRSRGLQPVEIVSAQQLALAEVQEHRIEGRERTLRLRTEAGLQIDAVRLDGVLNRLYTVPVDHWRRAPKFDRDYVQQELVAFFLSWLAALPCPVLNRPTPQGLCGQWRQESEWAWLARQAGLPVATYRQSSRDGIDEARGERRLVPAGAVVHSVVVIAGHVHGTAWAPAPALAAACARLAAAAGTEILGIDFVVGPGGGLSFAGANPTPDLRFGGAGLVDDLLQALTPRRVAARPAPCGVAARPAPCGCAALPAPCGCADRPQALAA